MSETPTSRPVVRRRRKNEPTPTPESAAETPVPVEPVEVAPPAPKVERGPSLSVDDLGDIAQMSADAFSAMFNDAAGLAGPRLRPGQEIEGTVLSVGERFVFVDVGGKAEATIELEELPEDQRPVPGDRLVAYVQSANEGGVRLSTRLQGPGVDDALQEAMEQARSLEGVVTGRNSGGFTVEIGGKRCFCPVSQIAWRAGNEVDHYVGQTLLFRVTAIRDGDVVVSRKVIEQEEREAAAEATLSNLRPGQVREGIVSALQPYGAFVDLGGVEGLVHVSQIAAKRVEDPSTELQIGQSVRVKVLDVDSSSGRISLSIRDAVEGVGERRSQKPREKKPAAATSGSFGTFADLFKQG